jgi:hypothetical protein
MKGPNINISFFFSQVTKKDMREEINDFVVWLQVCRRGWSDLNSMRLDKGKKSQGDPSPEILFRWYRFHNHQPLESLEL